MAKYGEWNRKGATLSDVTAKKEYGVDRDFIVEGIRTGKLEYREGSIWGSPYLRIYGHTIVVVLVDLLGQFVAQWIFGQLRFRIKATTEAADGIADTVHFDLPAVVVEAVESAGIGNAHRSAQLIEELGAPAQFFDALVQDRIGGHLQHLSGQV